jgi:hypothetical protein
MRMDNKPSLRAALETGIPQSLKAFPDGRLAWPVVELCRSIGISRSQYYELELVDAGPRKLQVGRRPMVTAEAAAEWLLRLESQGADALERLKRLREQRASERGGGGSSLKMKTPGDRARSDTRAAAK